MRLHRTVQFGIKASLGFYGSEDVWGNKQNVAKRKQLEKKSIRRMIEDEQIQVCLHCTREKCLNPLDCKLMKEVELKYRPKKVEDGLQNTQD